MSKTKIAQMYLAILLLPFITYLITYLAYGLSQKHSTVVTVNNVVARYIEYSSTMQWNKAQALLTGEALTNAMKNQAAALTAEKILSTKLTATPNGNLATVDAAIEKTAPYDDRQTYTFHLVKTAENWLIYKVEYKDFTRPVLGQNKGHSAAAEVLTEYLSLDVTQRTKNAEKYLAGNLLRATQINRPLQQSKLQQSNQRLEDKLISLTPVGSTAEVATYQAVIEEATLLADLVKVNNNWKIVNIDVIKVNWP